MCCASYQLQNPTQNHWDKAGELHYEREVIIMAWAYEYCPYELTFDEYISGSQTQCNVNESCHQICSILTAAEVFSQQV